MGAQKSVGDHKSLGAHKSEGAGRIPGSPCSRTAAGFTIVELITVVMLLGILSVVAFGRFVQPSAFTPGIVVHALLLEARYAQQLAASRVDARVTFTVDRDGSDWRFRTSTDLDGLVRTERSAADNTTLRARSGLADALIAPGVSLVVDFTGNGDLSSVLIGAVAGDPAIGVAFDIAGDSAREACLYPTGYSTDAACS